MANHKSALKRIRSNEAKRLRNKYQHKTTRNAVRDLRNASDKKEAETMLTGLCDDDFFHETKSHIDNKNVLKAVERLSLVRNELAEIDFRLDDCMTILGGYQKLLMGEAANEENE